MKYRVCLLKDNSFVEVARVAETGAIETDVLQLVNEANEAGEEIAEIFREHKRVYISNRMMQIEYRLADDLEQEGYKETSEIIRQRITR